MKIPQKAVDNICTTWELDKHDAHDEIYEWQNRIVLNETRKAVRDFHNEYLSQELYLSPNVAEKFSKIDRAILVILHARFLIGELRFKQIWTML